VPSYYLYTILMQLIKHIEKLPNPPLQEVIFEIHWMLETSADIPREHDGGFEMAQGILRRNLRERYSHYERMKVPYIPGSLSNRTIIHRFWKEKGRFPLIQFGPGILSVNETDKNYVWESGFFPEIKFALEQLCKSYENEIIFTQVELRYIDAIDLNPEVDLNILRFIQQNLQTEFRKHFEVPGVLSDLHFNETYQLEDDSLLNLVIASGVRTQDQQPAVIWQNAIIKTGEFDKSNIISWLDNAHSITSNLFKKMVSPDFFRSFTYDKH